MKENLNKERMISEIKKEVEKIEEKCKEIKETHPNIYEIVSTCLEQFKNTPFPEFILTKELESLYLYLEQADEEEAKKIVNETNGVKEGNDNMNIDKMIKNAYDEIIKYTENKPVVREISINALNEIESETDMPLIMKKGAIEMQKEFARTASDREVEYIRKALKNKISPLDLTNNIRNNASEDSFEEVLCKAIDNEINKKKKQEKKYYSPNDLYLKQSIESSILIIEKMDNKFKQANSNLVQNIFSLSRKFNTSGISKDEMDRLRSSIDKLYKAYRNYNQTKKFEPIAVNDKSFGLSQRANMVKGRVINTNNPLSGTITKEIYDKYLFVLSEIDWKKFKDIDISLFESEIVPREDLRYLLENNKIQNLSIDVLLNSVVYKDIVVQYLYDQL